MRRGGLALLVVAGVLGILAVLASAFALLARLERRASMQRVHASKALLLTRSGLEDALARLALDQAPSYGGENWDGLPGLSPFEAQQEVLEPGVLNRDDCPARHALRPSFFARLSPGNPDPALSQVDGRRRGASGALPGGAYALRAVPEDGIHVNGGDLSSAGEHPGTYDATLKRVLGNLAEELGLPRAQGEALVTARPAGGWRDLSAAPLAMRPYLVTRAWVDLKVIRPNVDPAWSGPATGLTGCQTASAWAEVRVGKRDTPVTVPQTSPAPVGSIPAGGIGPLWAGKRAFNPHTNSYAPDFERDSLGRIVGRAPVRLDWAKERPPALRALLRDLAGIRLDPSFMDRKRGGSTNVLFEEDQGSLGVFRTVSLGTADVAAAAAELQAHDGFPTWMTEYPDWDRTASFDSWDEFSRFVDLKLTMLAQPQRDLIKAAFNPNSDLNKSNPGESLFKELDKSDLTAYSTELCFRNPLLSISCAGRVTDAQGRLLAERTASATAAFRQLRLTTQSEFCAGDLGNPDLAGDESDFRLPGDPGFLETTPSPDRAWGSRLPGAGQGFCLQTYPEPQWPGSPCPPPAAYDGRLELATLETVASPGAVPGLTFLASFDSGFDATFSAGDPACAPDSAQAPPATPLFGLGPAATAAAVGTLHPDGCYSETRRAPGYASLANLGDGLQGLFSTWYKPAFGPVEAGGIFSGNRGVTLLTLNPLGKNPLLFPWSTVYGETQVFGVGALRYGQLNAVWGGLAEDRYAVFDNQMGTPIAMEAGAYFGWGWGSATRSTFWHAHRWHLLTFQWNLMATSLAAHSCMVVNADSHLSTGTPWYSAGIVPDGLGVPLTRDAYDRDGNFGPVKFFLGERGVTYTLPGSADGTLDELLFCTRSTSMTEAPLLASERFPAGRYVKEDAALDPSKPEYTTCALPLPAGSRILRTDATLVLPRAHPAPALAPDLWPDPSLVFYGTGDDPLAGETADVRIRVLAAPLRIGVDLRPRLGDNTGAWEKTAAPLLESPALDDLTLTWIPPEGARIVGWDAGG